MIYQFFCKDEKPFENKDLNDTSSLSLPVRRVKKLNAFPESSLHFHSNTMPFLSTMDRLILEVEEVRSLVFLSGWQNQKQHMLAIIGFTKDYNKLIGLNSLSYFRMQEFAKEEEFNKQEMNQNHSSHRSFQTTSRSGRPESQRYFDNENNLSAPVKIQNDISEPFQRQAEFNSGSEDSVARPLCKKSSIYHNFQKHLITTLKLHVNFSNWRRSNTTADRLMIEMWEFFIKSNRPTKRYLYSLLMNIPENIIEFKNKYSDKAHQEQFQRTITEASLEDLSKAQKNLRFHLMKQCKKLVENEQLNHRRMHKIDEFKEYFNTFINDLEKGELNLRLPKPKKENGKGIKRSKMAQQFQEKLSKK